MSNYESIFRINGIPILPPLMTEKVRKKMSAYKNAAIEVENRLKEKKSHHEAVSFHSDKNLTPGNTSLNISSEIYGISSMSESQLTSTDTESDYLNKIVPQVISQVVIDGLDTELEDKLKLNSTFSHLDQSESDITFSIAQSPGSKSVSAICDNTLQPTLFRSNSYTELHPSPALLKHLESQGIFHRPANSLEELRTPGIFTSRKTVKSPSTNKTMIIPSGKRKAVAKSAPPSTVLTPILKRKSPYDVKLTVTKPKSTPTTVTKKSLNETITNGPDLSTMISKIESDHQKQIVDLLRKHQDDQKRMEENFQRQQDLLLAKLNDSIKFRQNNNLTIRKGLDLDDDARNNNNGVGKRKSPGRAKSATPSMMGNLNFSDDGRNHNGDEIQMSCSRRLFSTSKKKAVTSSTVSECREQAATIINAHVRGYLTRRLFRTEFVAKVVQTIRDSLLLVIDLYEETRGSTNQTDIDLKIRTTQQLIASYNELHEIFFQTPLKIRLNLIATDRILLKKKFEKLKRLSKLEIIKL